MKRRQFLKTAGVGACRGRGRRARDRSSRCRKRKWRLTSSFPKSLDTIYGAAEVFSKAVAEATDNKFQIQVFAAGEIVPGLQAADAVQHRHGRDVPHRVLLLFRQGSDLRVRHRRAVRAQQPHAERLDVLWRRHRPDERLLQEVNIYAHAGRQHRLPDGRLVPQGDQGRRRPQRPQDAHRRLRRPRADQARRGAAADRWRRHLSGAGEGHARRLRMGRPLRRREARLLQGRASTTTTRAGGKAARCCTTSSTSTNGTRCSPTYKSIVRTRVDGWPTNGCRRKYDAANPAALKRLVAGGAELRPFSRPVLEACLQGIERTLRGDVGQERGFQENL